MKLRVAARRPGSDGYLALSHASRLRRNAVIVCVLCCEGRDRAARLAEHFLAALLVCSVRHRDGERRGRWVPRTLCPAGRKGNDGWKSMIYPRVSSSEV